MAAHADGPLPLATVASWLRTRDATRPLTPRALLHAIYASVPHCLFLDSLLSREEGDDARCELDNGRVRIAKRKRGKASYTHLTLHGLRALVDTLQRAQRGTPPASRSGAGEAADPTSASRHTPGHPIDVQHAAAVASAWARVAGAFMLIPRLAPGSMHTVYASSPAGLEAIVSFLSSPVLKDLNILQARMWPMPGGSMDPGAGSPTGVLIWYSWRFTHQKEHAHNVQASCWGKGWTWNYPYPYRWHAAEGPMLLLSSCSDAAGTADLGPGSSQARAGASSGTPPPTWSAACAAPDSADVAADLEAALGRVCTLASDSSSDPAACLQALVSLYEQHGALAGVVKARPLAEKEKDRYRMWCCYRFNRPQATGARSDWSPEASYMAVAPLRSSTRTLYRALRLATSHTLARSHAPLRQRLLQALQPHILAASSGSAILPLLCIQHGDVHTLAHLLDTAGCLRLARGNALGGAAGERAGAAACPSANHDTVHALLHGVAARRGEAEEGDGEEDTAADRPPWERPLSVPVDEACSGTLLCACILFGAMDCLQLLLGHGVAPSARMAGAWRLGVMEVGGMGADPPMQDGLHGSLPSHVQQLLPAGSRASQQPASCASWCTACGQHAAYCCHSRGSFPWHNTRCQLLQHSVSASAMAFYLPMPSSIQDYHHAHVRPLHIAAELGCTAAAQALVEAGATDAWCVSYLGEPGAVVPVVRAMDIAVLRGNSALQHVIARGGPCLTPQQPQLQAASSAQAAATGSTSLQAAAQAAGAVAAHAQLPAGLVLLHGGLTCLRLDGAGLHAAATAALMRGLMVSASSCCPSILSG